MPRVLRTDSCLSGGVSLALLVLLPVVSALLSLTIGKYGISVAEILRVFSDALFGTSLSSDPLAGSIIFSTRLPRILTAMLVGAGLAVSGAVFQGLFKNPLASPYTLGVSNGAGFGAALAISLTTQTVIIQGTAMLFGLVAVGLTFLMCRRARNSTVTLVLAGLLVGNLFAALLSLIKFFADPFEKLPSITFWLMGSLSSATNGLFLSVLPPFLLATGVLFLYRWRLNILSMGDNEARAYGVDVAKDRAVIILCCSLITALCVSVSGIIGWIGLIIPHIARAVTGPDQRRLFPLTLSFGAVYLLLIDDFCRCVSSLEIPLGIVTALLGSPIFAWFLLKEKLKW